MVLFIINSPDRPGKGNKGPGEIAHETSGGVQSPAGGDIRVDAQEHKRGKSRGEGKGPTGEKNTTKFLLTDVRQQQNSTSIDVNKPLKGVQPSPPTRGLSPANLFARRRPRRFEKINNLKLDQPI
ncbi:hypothetical protein AAG570_004120 [Ranatra chinensis]|uniref:Uncharacterized protein n=1 Tax=Ranatra chinensis TaxID=642074 RepID=A0ABD0Y551_9HEMI